MFTLSNVNRAWKLFAITTSLDGIAADRALKNISDATVWSVIVEQFSSVNTTFVQPDALHKH